MIFNATYEFSTPVYLGGANHAPEFRLASYVHILRWWWRFLGLGRFETVDRASYWEATLFGRHSKEFGRKRVSFRLSALEDRYVAPWGQDPDLERWSGINYLTAQGFKQRQPAQVACFSVEGRISNRSLSGDIPDFAVRSGQSADEEWCLALETLIDAVALIGLLGGLGARSRRGFGSMAIRELKVRDGSSTEELISGLSENEAAYRQLIETHLGNARRPEQPPYSALCQGFRYDICARASNARDLMNDIGWAFQIYRSWGQKKPRLANIPANLKYFHARDISGPRNNRTGKYIKAGPLKTWYRSAFKSDHNNFYKNMYSGTDSTFDNRSIFGLPHNYYKTDVGWDSETLEQQDGQKHRRRASPLLFHFHHLANGHTVFLASVIPARFTPVDAKLRVGGNLRMEIDPEVDYAHLTEFASFVRNGTGGTPPVPHTSYTVVP